MANKRSKKLLEADAFRERVQRLRAIPDSDWNDWEADWLDSEAARNDDYIYTDKERVILNQLIASATTFEDYNGLSVAELVRMASQYKADLDEDSERFVDRLCRRQPTTLKVREISRLASICRTTEDVGRDEDVEIVLRATRRKEQDLDEIPDFVPFREDTFSRFTRFRL